MNRLVHNIKKNKNKNNFPEPKARSSKCFSAPVNSSKPRLVIYYHEWQEYLNNAEYQNTKCDVFCYPETELSQLSHIVQTSCVMETSQTLKGPPDPLWQQWLSIISMYMEVSLNSGTPIKNRRLTPFS